MNDAVRTRTARRWRPAAALLATALVLAPAACGDDDDDEASTGAADEGSGGADYGGGGSGEGSPSGSADATLEVVAIEYDDVTAPAGGTLEVVNSSGAGHTFTADDGSFDESFGDGETVTVEVPAEPGEYPFHCEIHPSMEATLTAE
jgi:plastocyanin